MILLRSEGFLSGRSTATVYSNLFFLVGHHICISPFFCDLSRAFDSVNYNILLEVIESFGIKGIMRTCLEFSYIRSSSVCIDTSRVSGMYSTN